LNKKRGVLFSALSDKATKTTKKTKTTTHSVLFCSSQSTSYTVLAGKSQWVF